MTDITDTDYFDKPADNVIIKYLPHFAVVAFVMIATGFWYANLAQDNSRSSNASEIYVPPIQLPTSATTPTPTPSITILRK
jgi:hypothetical protein